MFVLQENLGKSSQELVGCKLGNGVSVVMPGERGYRGSEGERGRGRERGREREGGRERGMRERER